jgi:hypothetical protein
VPELPNPVASHLWLFTALQAQTKRNPKQIAKVVVAATVSEYQF